jgi:hypothetical protein
MLCVIPASQSNLGDLVKVFEDHLYFMMEDKRQISVVSYTHDRLGLNVTTKEEMMIKLACQLEKT